MNDSTVLTPTVPIVIAVAGHINVHPASVSRLTSDVEKFLCGLAMYENPLGTLYYGEEPRRRKKSGPPVYLLTALAEGADRIVARTALGLKKQRGFDFRLGVILPMEEKYFKRDFKNAASTQEFDDLFRDKNFVHVVTPGECPESGPERDERYLEGGLFLCRHSQILVALWDGRCFDRKVGGTTDLVIRQLEGNSATKGREQPALPQYDAGPVVHIRTPRDGDNYSIDEDKQETTILVPSLDHGMRSGIATKGIESELRRKEEVLRWDAILRAISEFNSDAVECLQDPTRSIKISNSRNYLCFNKPDVTPEDEKRLPPRAQGATARRIADLYAVADSISIEAKERRESILRRIMLSTALAFLLNELYTGPTARPVVLVSVLLFIGVAILLYFFIIKRGRLETRFIDYRAFAEILRVQYFWHLVSMPHRAADHSLRYQLNELEWMRQAAINVLIPTESGNGPGENANVQSTPDPRCFISAKEKWVCDQKKYFHGLVHGRKKPDGTPDHPVGKLNLVISSAQQILYGKRFRGPLADLSKGIDWWLKGFFVISAFLAIATLLSHLNKGWDVCESPREVLWLIVGYQMCVVFAAFCKVYKEVMAFEEDNRRYKKPLLVFQRAFEKLSAETRFDPDEQKRVLFELGREALVENEEWLTRHHEREVEVPIG